MESEVGEYGKSLSSLSSGVVDSLSSEAITSWQGAGSTASSSPKMSPAIAKPFNPQSLRELKIQSQLQPHSEILKQLEMEMSQSPQATILRRMKEARNEEENSSSKLEDERIIYLEKQAMARELDYLLAEEVPATVADVMRALTVCMDDLKGDAEEQNRENEVTETLEEQKARLRKKVALNLDSMLKYGSGPKGKEKEREEEEERALEENKKGPKRSHLMDFNTKTDEGVTSLRGFAAISGPKIYKSELRLEVRPTWGKKLPLAVKVQVSPLAPLRLPQIQNAHNYLRMAIGELKRLQRLMSRNEGKAEEENLHYAMLRIKDELRMAREELVTNEMHEFPDNLFVPNGFLPALPPEISVEFHVFNSQLILSVYILQISPVPAKLARESQGLLLSSNGAYASDVSPGGGGRNRAPKSHMRLTPTVGQSYVIQGKKIEIMDAIRIPCDVPLIKANDLINELRDKLMAVST